MRGGDHGRGGTDDGGGGLVAARVRNQRLRRLSFVPLWRLCMARYGAQPWAPDYWEGFTVERCAAMLGCTERAVGLMQREGVSVWQADRWAIAFGSHPLLVWGDDWVAAAVFDELERVA